MGKLLNSNKAIKLILMGLVVVIIGLAAVLFTTSVIHKDKEVSAQSSIDTVSSQNMIINSSQDYAEKLYRHRVEDVNDTVAVVKFLETMGLEDVTGEYTAMIKAKGNTEVLSLKLKDAVQKTNKNVFDSNMEKCAQQMMALMPSIGKVQWTYSMISSGAEDQKLIVSLDIKGANKLLAQDVKKYGESAEAFRNLLIEQSGQIEEQAVDDMTGVLKK